MKKLDELEEIKDKQKKILELIDILFKSQSVELQAKANKILGE